jgi:hypothetical protein
MLALVLLFLLIAVPAAIEVFAWFTAAWWHSDTPKDPRNGI